MVFKVKQRAKKDYYKQIGSEETANIPTYSDNWPFDFFSLVEVADLDVEVEFKPSQRNLEIKEQRKAGAEAALKLQAELRNRALEVGSPED